MMMEKDGGAQFAGIRSWCSPYLYTGPGEVTFSLYFNNFGIVVASSSSYMRINSLENSLRPLGRGIGDSDPAGTRCWSFGKVEVGVSGSSLAWKGPSELVLSLHRLQKERDMSIHPRSVGESRSRK